jgi:hypothetical protein
MTACFFALLYVKVELSYDRYHENRNNIFRLVTGIETSSGIRYESTSAPMAQALKETFPEIKDAVRILLDYMMIQRPMIINEKMVHTLGFSKPEDAIGKRFSQGGNDRTIIGVVKNFHTRSFHEKIQPLTFQMATGRYTFFTFQLSGSNIAETVADLEEKWRQLVAGIPFYYFFADDAYNAQYRKEERFGKLFVCFFDAGHTFILPWIDRSLCFFRYSQNERNQCQKDSRIFGFGHHAIADERICFGDRCRLSHRDTARLAGGE